MGNSIEHVNRDEVIKNKKQLNIHNKENFIGIKSKIYKICKCRKYN